MMLDSPVVRYEENAVDNSGPAWYDENRLLKAEGRDRPWKMKRR